MRLGRRVPAFRWVCKKCLWLQARNHTTIHATHHRGSSHVGSSRRIGLICRPNYTSWSLLLTRCVGFSREQSGRWAGRRLAYESSSRSKTDCNPSLAHSICSPLAQLLCQRILRFETAMLCNPQTTRVFQRGPHAVNECCRGVIRPSVVSVVRRRRRWLFVLVIK